ncbi:unnamed protein product [Ranitomeya imitator]|uniref:Uncharacterized protein n=1 Tax=Ranitomeya imitator TaxID=111125 RepID=A0ABN9LCN7_9NEOB|nr:unnamed protein product [Ranitomeya imitator]
MDNDLSPAITTRPVSEDNVIDYLVTMAPVRGGCVISKRSFMELVSRAGNTSKKLRKRPSSDVWMTDSSLVFTIVEFGLFEVVNRTSHSRAKADAAAAAALKAQEEAQIARIAAKEFSPSFQHRENGLKCQRPKHQNSCDDIEVISTETPPQPDSPELYRKGTTPSDVTPDDSPMRSPLCSPPSTPPQPAPKSRNKSAHFSPTVVCGRGPGRGHSDVAGESGRGLC